MSETTHAHAQEGASEREKDRRKSTTQAARRRAKPQEQRAVVGWSTTTRERSSALRLLEGLALGFSYVKRGKVTNLVGFYGAYGNMGEDRAPVLGENCSACKIPRHFPAFSASFASFLALLRISPTTNNQRIAGLCPHIVALIDGYRGRGVRVWPEGRSTDGVLATCRRCRRCNVACGGRHWWPHRWSILARVLATAGDEPRIDRLLTRTLCSTLVVHWLRHPHVRHTTCIESTQLSLGSFTHSRYITVSSTMQKILQHYSTR